MDLPSRSGHEGREIHSGSRTRGHAIGVRKRFFAGGRMVEAVMLWNEPNNLSHWDFKLDSDWRMFAEMVTTASRAVRRENPELPLVLGGISPIDPNFITLMKSHG